MLPEIRNFHTLESVLDQGLNEIITIDSRMLKELSGIFFQLHERITGYSFENDVLKTFSVPEEFDEVVEELRSRARCAELFLKYGNLPSDLIEIHTKNLPALKKSAKLSQYIVENQKGMLQDLREAGIKPLNDSMAKPKNKNKSGCMVSFLIFIIFTSLLCFA